MDPSSSNQGTEVATQSQDEKAGLVPSDIVPSLPPPPRSAEMLYQEEGKRLYWDRSHYDSPASQMKALKRSATLYVGNLSFRTRSRHVRSHFNELGPVKAIHMGLDRLKKTPCGFCFVEYLRRSDALAAVALLSGTKLCGSIIRCELDAGFQAGRQYGRGVSGGQVRDDKRKRARENSFAEPPTRNAPSATEQDRREQDSTVTTEGGDYYERSGDDADERPMKRQRT